MTYLSRAFWSSLRAKPSGTYVYRGYAAACAASGRSKDVGKRSRSASRSRRGSASSIRSAAMEKEDSLLKRTISRDQASGLADTIRNVDINEQETKVIGRAAHNVKDDVLVTKDNAIPEPRHASRPGEQESTQRLLGAMEEENTPLVSRATRYNTH